MQKCSKCGNIITGYPKTCPKCRNPLTNPETLRSSITSVGQYASLANITKNYDSVIVFDTETSGLDFSSDRVIELSAIRLNCNATADEKSELDILIKLPEGEKLLPQITELTHITDEMLCRDGVEESDAVDRFLSLITGERTLLAAHNAQFDMNFLFHMLKRQAKSDVLKKCDMLDTLTVYKDRRDYPHRLENAIIEYGLEGKVKNSHRAIDDTKALFEVMRAMDCEYPDLGCYINLFGYNPKYGVSGSKIRSVHYVPQPYSNRYERKLYNEIPILTHI